MWGLGFGIFTLCPLSFVLAPLPFVLAPLSFVLAPLPFALFLMLSAIVPVKPFLQSKQRLAGVLSPQERARLSRDLLSHTLRVLTNAPEVTQTFVVSRDPAALTLAKEYQAQTIIEAGSGGLNAALTQTTEVAQASGAETILILLADLPFLSPEAIQALVRESKTQPIIVIAPDRHEDGTNALCVHPPHLITYAFGERSFQRHIAQAEHIGVPVRICRLPELALDVDTPEDLERLPSFFSAVSRPPRPK